jgi:hypothetical protein
MSTGLANITIDEEHSRAICEEIGDRLRVALDGPLPASPILDRLIARLIELDDHDSPSIVPAIDSASPGLKSASDSMNGTSIEA